MNSRRSALAKSLTAPRPAKSFNARFLPGMRKEALENAMRGMFGKLIDHLRDKPKS